MRVIIAVVAALVVAGVAGYAVAQDSELHRYEGDGHTTYDSRIPVFGDAIDQEYYWAFNPQNHTIYYRDNGIADPIHIGPWDVIARSHYDNMTNKYTFLDDDGIIDRERATLLMLRYLVNVTDTQAAQIEELQETVEAQQLQIDKQAKKIIKLESALGSK